MTRDTSAKPVYDSNDARWEAVRSRDARADGQFVYAVRTTGVYCRPSASSRLPRRENIEFFASAEDAEFVSLNGRDCFVKTAPNDMPEILLPKKENLNGAI